MLYIFKEEDLGRFTGHTPMDSILVIKMLEQKVPLYHDDSGQVFFKGREGLSLLARLRQLRESNGGRTQKPQKKHYPFHGKLLLKLRHLEEIEAAKKSEDETTGKELQ